MNERRVKTGQSGSWRYWLPRLFLIPPTFILTMISLRIITDPVHAAGEAVTFSSPQAITHMRIMGVFTMGYAIGLVICIFSKERLRLGLLTVAFLMFAAIVIRAYGVITDGTSLQDEQWLFIAEAVFLTLSIVGLFIEKARVRAEGI